MARSRALAFAATLIVIAGCGGASQTKRPRAAAPLFVAPSGNDAGRCSREAPCRSIARAYRVARGGQAIELLGGTYPAQEVGPARAPAGGSVVVRPATRARVRFSGRLTVSGVARLGFEDLGLARTGATDRSLFVGPCVSDVTFTRVSGETFFLMEGTDHVTFRGGSWGGYRTPGEEDSAIGTDGATGPVSTCHGRPAAPATHILFDRVTFHDVFWRVPSSGWGGSHPDCFEINGYVDGVTVRNSRFLRCASTFTQMNGDQGSISNVTFERNLYRWLGGDTWYGIQITKGSPGYCAGVVFRRNTYLPENPRATTWPNGPIRTDCVPRAGAASVDVSSNLFARAPSSWECARYAGRPSFARWEANVFGSGSCGRASRGLPFGYALGRAGLALSSDAATVRLAFDLAAQGRTHAQIAAVLAGRRAPAGGWSDETVGAILSDPVYRGDVVGAPGANPAVVSRGVWRAAQRVAGT